MGGSLRLLPTLDLLEALGQPAALSGLPSWWGRQGSHPSTFQEGPCAFVTWTEQNVGGEGGPWGVGGQDGTQGPAQGTSFPELSSWGPRPAPPALQVLPLPTPGPSTPGGPTCRTGVTRVGGPPGSCCLGPVRLTCGPRPPGSTVQPSDRREGVLAASLPPACPQGTPPSKMGRAFQAEGSPPAAALELGGGGL